MMLEIDELFGRDFVIGFFVPAIALVAGVLWVNIWFVSTDLTLQFFTTALLRPWRTLCGFR